MRITTQHSKITLALIGLTVLTACGGSREEPKPRPAAAEVECMARAMYFESNRSSPNGMLAVGSVVMNRVHSDSFPNTVCGVVGQRNQFAPGVMTKPMNKGAGLARQMAVAVLSGERHPKVSRAKFFHAAWYRANYNNMHYVVTAGGNAFYEKRRPEQVTNRRPFPEE
ncbi:cell wall hydrolase [Sulfitobacter delicatus]|uniref:Cell Wall Hydrolase n=1 Tax=Sulfitobacter delicatus TaxID=218672 RepID=A0A1G7S431_9RHOB|nr:Cell Wall Hydrolase [Sulfitobacter delicatus]